MAPTQVLALEGSTEDAKSVGTWQAILTIILFFLSNFAVIFPVHVPIPAVALAFAHDALAALQIVPPRSAAAAVGSAPRRHHLHLNFITVPLFSVLILLAAGVFTGKTVRDGIVGSDGIQPLNIMALFISLAYISISLDATGLFRFLAFWVASKGGSSGRVLYAYFYLFFLVCGVLVGNDPVILSGTAFLAYFTRVAGITPPTAWIFAQFTAANMASVVLVSSNPTNLVLAGAFGLSFLTYAAHVALPFLAAALAVFPLLLFGLFRSRSLSPSLSPSHPPHLIPCTLDVALAPHEVRAALVDKRGAVFGGVLMLVTLGVLVGVSTVGVPVWEVTVPPACVMFGRDVWYDWTTHRVDKEPDGKRAQVEEEHAGVEVEVEEAEDVRPRIDPDEDEDEAQHEGAGAPSALEMRDLSSRAPTLASPPSPTLPSPAFSTPTPTPRSKSKPTPVPPLTLTTLLAPPLTRLAARFPTAAHVGARLPLALLPFALLMFVLVQGLAAQGWVGVFARWWAAWVRAAGVLGAVGGMGLVSCLMCNFCGTNIGATILLARVLQAWASSLSSSPLSSSASASSSSWPTTPADRRAHAGAIYALALGSNFGACTLTFSASLAGLLWRAILRQKGVRVRAREFLRLNLPISAVAMGVGCAVLVGQVYVEYR